MNTFTYTIYAIPEIITELKSKLKFTKTTDREITVFCELIDEKEIIDI